MPIESRSYITPSFLLFAPSLGVTRGLAIRADIPGFLLSFLVRAYCVGRVLFRDARTLGFCRHFPTLVFLLKFLDLFILFLEGFSQLHGGFLIAFQNSR